MEVRIGLDLHRGPALVHNGPSPVTGNRHIDGCSLGVIGGQRRLVHNLVAVDHGLCSRTRTGEVAVVPLDENTWITRHLVGRNVAFGNFPTVMHQIGSFRRTQRRGNADATACRLYGRDEGADLVAKAGVQVLEIPAGREFANPCAATQFQYTSTCGEGPRCRQSTGKTCRDTGPCIGRTGPQELAIKCNRSRARAAKRTGNKMDRHGTKGLVSQTQSIMRKSITRNNCPRFAFQTGSMIWQHLVRIPVG